tara:strand:- start:5964 stop:6518 length:555 start_codon:yes stop_codon:yes gene_type:complete
MKYFILILSFILSIIFPTSTFSNDKLISKLQSGGNIVFIRHALAPGSGDPENINLNDCSTQRNLSERGINQSKKIGEFFKQNNIPIDQVLSSEWCRCKDTAKFAFKNFNTFPDLNSFYDEKFYKNKDKQIRNLKKFIKNWKSNKNLVLITHYVVILEMLDIGVSSGEFAISDKNLNLIGSLNST